MLMIDEGHAFLKQRARLLRIALKDIKFGSVEAVLFIFCSGTRTGIHVLRKYIRPIEI
jgi:hypothetical protein